MDALFEKNSYETELPVRCGRMNGTDSYLYHWHDAVEILCGISGCTRVSVESEPFELHSGDVLVIAPRLNHCVFTSEPEDYRMAVCFDAEYFFKTQERISIFSRMNFHSSRWPEGVREQVLEMLGDIYEEALVRKDGWQGAVCGNIYGLEVIFARQTGVREAPVQPDSLKTRSVRRVLEYVSENYLRPITLASCAKALGFNESYFSTLFKTSLGTTFHGYLTDPRLNKAAQLLKDTELSVGDICDMCGFGSLKTFHRVFRNKYGAAPGEYRKNETSEAISRLS